MAINHIHGDTFDYVVTLPTSFANGYFSDWTVTSQVRTSRYQQFVAEINCTWLDSITTRDLKIFALSTTSWPVADCEMDIQFVRNSDKYTFSSNLISISVLKDVTRPDGITLGVL